MNITRTAAIVAALAVVVALGSGVWIVMTRGGDCGRGVVGGDIGGPFTLVDSTGRTVTERDIITGPALIYFGYTHCPDVCPLDAARNAEAVDLLEERGISVTPVFITVDPERDTPEIVGEFASYMHPRMIGLTGTPEQVKAAADAYRAYFAKAGEDGEDYLMDHSTLSYLVTPDGFLDFFRHEESAEAVAERAACLLR